MQQSRLRTEVTAPQGAVLRQAHTLFTDGAQIGSASERSATIRGDGCQPTTVSPTNVAATTSTMRRHGRGIPDIAMAGWRLCEATVARYIASVDLLQECGHSCCRNGAASQNLAH